MAQGYKGINQIYHQAKQNIKSLMNTATETESAPKKDVSIDSEILEEITGQKEKLEQSALLSNGNWFLKYPNKILGEEYETTNAFNRIVTRVKGGNDEVIAGIETPEVHTTIRKSDPLTTVIDNLENQDESLAIANLDQVIEQSINEEAKSNIDKEYFINKSVERAIDLMPLKEAFEMYNKGISEAEIKAWVWYKLETGGFKKSDLLENSENGWIQYITPEDKIEEAKNEWLKDGIICAIPDGTYIPSVLYFAENVSQKQSELLSSKESFISRFGEEQYNRQYDGLENITPEKLTLSNPEVSNRLSINPKSGFVQSTIINELSDGTVLRNPLKGEEGVTLISGFITWLRSLPANRFKKSNSSYIIRYYLQDSHFPRGFTKEDKARIGRNAKLEGNVLFSDFLAQGITRDDQLKIEHTWNSTYNGYVEINFKKIPVGFQANKTFKNKPLFVRPAQRDGLGFLSVYGSGCISYDVGVGKTMTAILAIGQALQSGQCKRPLIVVPNQTYTNWLNEIQGTLENGDLVLSGILPQYRINDLYNLGANHQDQITNEDGSVIKLAENSITVMTYEGFNKLAYNDQTWNELKEELYDVLNQGATKERDKEMLYGKIEELMGKGLKGGFVNIEDLGIDFLVVDEAHSMKKSFTQVKGEIKGGAKRGKTQYKLNSGVPSSIALRGFMMSQYILRNNNMRNVVLLTATPFTNSPLEIFSMLALVGYQQLVKNGINNIKDFFDLFINTSTELVINAKLKPQHKEVVLGFNNLIALQQLIFRFIDYKTGEDANIQRPNKIVLPMDQVMRNDVLVKLPPAERVSTNIPMNSTQLGYMSDVEAYVTGDIELGEFCNPEVMNTDAVISDGDPLAEEQMNEEEQEGTRILRGLSLASQLALSPYLFACQTNKTPSPNDYVEESPKILYTVRCIESIKADAERLNVDMPGQVIYMNAGVRFFTLIKQYLIQYSGFKKSEVGIIKSGMSAEKKNSVKDLFNAGEVKVLIGSSTIKEGINLQYRSTDLYDLWLDWNPTDIKQLEGRIWRQGNRYANVRITFPLVEGSIDIFKFQKLQEKTSRINEIWYRAGKSNTLKLEELNPAELKKGLIKDPSTLAELMLMEDKEVMLDEINEIKNQIEQLETIASARNEFDHNIEKMRSKVKFYKPDFKEDSKIENLFRVYKNYLDDPETSTLYTDMGLLETIRKAHYTIQSGLKNILNPRGISLSFDLKSTTSRMQEEIDSKNEILEKKTGRDAVKLLTQSIVKDRETNQIKTVSVQERVLEFSRLNEKVITDYIANDEVPSRKAKKKSQAKRGKVLKLSSDLMDDISKIEKLHKDLKKLNKINQDLDRLLVA